MECLKYVYESIEAANPPRKSIGYITFHHNQFSSFKTPYVVERYVNWGLQKMQMELESITDIRYFRRHKFEIHDEGEVFAQHYTIYIVFVDRYDVITLCTIPERWTNSAIYFHKYPGMNIEDLSRLENSKTWFATGDIYTVIPRAPIFGMCLRLQSFLSSENDDNEEEFPICKLCGVCCCDASGYGRWNLLRR